MRIAILQPLIPQYRESFFESLSLEIDTDLYVYLNNEKLKNKGLQKSSIFSKYLKSVFIKNKIFIYDFFPLLQGKYDVIILPGELRSLSTWLLLFLLKCTKKKVILWGHGISVKNYLHEEKKLSNIRVLFHQLSDQIWLYTDREKEIWDKYISSDKIVALNNTINTTSILNLPVLDKHILKDKYKIKTKITLIYCARFTQNRRIDLMVEFIEKVKTNNIGIIIIGDGEYKPDFSTYKNVFDFGAVYDEKVKNELFSIADLYFQPGWTGLSIVEAMAYGKPIITFKRSENILQCVEYSYIKDNINGKIVNEVDEIIEYLDLLTSEELKELQFSTKNYAKEHLNQEKMIQNLSLAIKKLI